MDKKTFKALFANARQTGKGVEFKVNGSRAYCTRGVVVYLTDDGKVVRGVHYGLEYVTHCKTNGLRRAARDILHGIKKSRLEHMARNTQEEQTA